jgi:hypothetical protein
MSSVPQLARKIASEQDPRTQSGLDLLSSGEDLSRIPEHVAFVDWHQDVFQEPVSILNTSLETGPPEEDPFTNTCASAWWRRMPSSYFMTTVPPK